MQKHLSRFTLAQSDTHAGYSNALAEFTRYGHKAGHWIWYIFPQLEHEFPGQSYNNRYYGIQGLEEAHAYLADETLSRRLLEITSTLLALQSNDPTYVMGSQIDARKLCSCMTLFSFAAPEQKVFEAVLQKYFEGKKCKWTMKILQQA